MITVQNWQFDVKIVVQELAVNFHFYTSVPGVELHRVLFFGLLF
jgi:hypothetical protein